MRLPKKIIDTNVILRFFLADDEKQFPGACEFIQALEAGNDEALLTEMVFAEVVWVLQKVYAVPRAEIALKFSRIIQGLGIIRRNRRFVGFRFINENRVAVKVGVGKQFRGFLEIHYREIKFIIVFVDPRAATDDLLELGQRLDSLVQDD